MSYTLVIVGTIVQLTITSKVMGLSFEGFLKSLPSSMPTDLKSIITKLREKHPQEFGMLETTDHGTKTPLYAKANELDAMFMKPTSIKPGIQYNAPVTPKVNILKTGEPTANNNSTSEPAQTEKAVTTLKPPTAPTPKLPDAGCQTPVMPLPQIPPPMMPIAIPMYPRMPIIVPARTFFEPVRHDHPPLYKIKEMIERDERKWKKENKGKDCDGSLELAYSDGDSSSSSETDSESRYMDVGSEYYDGFLKINI
ncbi:uncharacterized protein LOC118269914 [Spodoptera frugiperda]|uniref:Uncharacterized protein LOC118269914 n=1 Tax=Spodoptera frugiperda TaxID=7108 RepID=A0A9R0EKS1_SPOFR|nr:uncharacterized protein LOC118269914 [Spodoptera frugiperda]